MSSENSVISEEDTQHNTVRSNIPEIKRSVASSVYGTKWKHFNILHAGGSVDTQICIRELQKWYKEDWKKKESFIFIKVTLLMFCKQILYILYFLFCICISLIEDWLSAFTCKTFANKEYEYEEYI